MDKKNLIILLFLLLSVAGFSQRLSVGINGGFDKNFNKYYDENNYSSINTGKIDFNGGVNVAYRLGSWLRFRVDFKYSEYAYGREPSSSSSEIKETILHAYHLGFTPRFDFLVWKKNEFELYLSPGLYFEYLLDVDQISIRSDGSNSYRHYISTDYRDTMTGVVGGAMLKYNLTDHIGLTFSPDYTLFFDELYEENDALMQRISANFGIEWTL